MADNRKPYPQFNPFRGAIINELTRRKTTYPFSANVPFVRLTSCLSEPKLGYMFFTLGLHGFDEGQDFDIFSESYGPKRETVGYAYDMNKRVNGKMTKKLISADQLTLDDFTNLPNGVLNPLQAASAQSDRESLINTAKTIYSGGAHPIPGITGVSVKLRGLGEPIVTEVEWTCYNRAQLEFLRHHFLTAGNYVVVEWGQQFSDKKLTKTLDFSTDTVIRNVLVDSIFKGREFINEEWVKPNDGNYNYVVGTVGNFTVDIDAKYNIYTCRTVIYSIGEQVYGLSMDTTFVKSFAPDGSVEQSSVNTMRDFFGLGLHFDVLVNQNSDDPSLVSGNYANWAKNNANVNEKASDLKDVSFNPEDYRFVSWKFFTKILLPAMYNLIEHENVRNELPRIADFWVDEATQPSDPAYQDWVGDNPFLRSVEPDSILIIKPNMRDVTPPAYVGAGMFGDGTGYRGRLNTGVWLNTGMIRQCFAEAESFERGLAGVLLRMSSATSNFWGLQLFWDEETARFKIIDMKYMDTQGLPPFWKFNDGAQGELLSIKFDSAFPPELVSQMAMYAKFKNETPMTKDNLISQFPMIGTTSTFIFSVNYTSFHDVLGPDIEARRNGASLVATTDNIGARTLEQQNDTTKAKVTAAITAPTAGTVTDGKTPRLGQPLNSNNIKTDDYTSQRNPLTVDVLRNSVAPISNAEFLTLSAKAAPFKMAIDTAAARYGVDPDLIRAVMAHESTFNPKAVGQNGKDFGLMQVNTGVHLDTAAAIKGRPVRAEELFDPSFNSLVGTAILKDSLRAANSSVEEALSRYNGWHGRNLDGTFKNQPYVNAVMHYYNVFLMGGNKSSVQMQGPNTTLPQQTPRYAIDPTQPQPTPEQNQEAINNQALQDKMKNVNTRFGPGMWPLIEPMYSTLLNKISRHGYENYPKPNGFVGGFPTTATVTVELLGLAGISVSDGFFVDKLPFIFERHGVFQTVEITDSITANGWITTVRGVFKLCWLEGSGHPLPPLTGQ